MQTLPIFATISEDHLVLLQSLNPHSEERSRTKLLRIHLSRIDVLSATSVLPGTLIQLRHRGTFLLGVACCCNSVEGFFQIGVEVEDTFLTQVAASFHADSNDVITLRA
jgi:hypothetical protein